MIDPKFFDDLSQKLADAMPDKLKSMQQDMQSNFRSLLQSSFNKLDLVTREEFDVQKNVLAKTRAKLDALEKEIAAMTSPKES